VHLQDFPTLPAHWRDEALASKWDRVREIRRLATTRLEEMRSSKEIGSSLQAEVRLGLAEPEISMLTAEQWAEIFIVSDVHLGTPDSVPAGRTRLTETLSGTPGELFKGHEDVFVDADAARGEKCARCWRVLPEVGTISAHHGLCARCADAVESGLVCKAAAE
jgi:isoleucyl-tRNA synthetase